jgi:hypothetical protein
MSKEFVDLKKVLATQDPMKHVKAGMEVLPQAQRQLPSGLERIPPKSTSSDQDD